MILFIFEGKNDEPRLYKTLKEIFHFELKEEEIVLPKVNLDFFRKAYKVV